MYYLVAFYPSGSGVCVEWVKYFLSVGIPQLFMQTLTSELSQSTSSGKLPDSRREMDHTSLLTSRRNQEGSASLNAQHAQPLPNGFKIIKLGGDGNFNLYWQMLLTGFI